MKVLIVNGSPRPKGNTACALEELAAQLKANGIIQRAFYSNGGRAPGEARLDAEGMQTMRALANNLAHLLHVTGGQPAPGRCDEPWTPMHFIR